MERTCRDYRIEWLAGERPATTHAHACAACSAWTRAAERLYAELGSLSRMQAPPELEARVAEELTGNRSRRLERILGSTVRHGAPAELDARVDALLARRKAVGDEARGSHKARAIRALDVHPAPEVLERLLDEELRDPSRHLAERFPGGLERLRAPLALEERLRSSLSRRTLSRLVLGPLATLAAAALIVWITLLRGDSAEHRYRFEVIQAASLDELDPLARAFAESLGGMAPPGEPR